MSRWPEVALGDVLTQQRREESVLPDRDYRLLGAHWYAKGLYIKHEKSGAEIRGSKLYRIEAGDFVYNRLFAWKGSFAVASADVDGCHVSNEFPCFAVDAERLVPRYLLLYFSREDAWNEALGQSFGATPTSRNRLKEAKLLAMKMPLPPIEEQRRVVRRIEQLATKADCANQLGQGVKNSIAALASARTHAVFASIHAPMLPLAGLADVRGGIQRTPGREPRDSPVRYLTVAHVQRGSVSTEDPRYFEVNAKELDRYRLLSGDVLIIEGNGSAAEIGRAALFGGDIDPCVHQNHVIRIRPDTGVMRPSFLTAFLNSPVGQEEVQRRSRTTSGLRTLSVGRIKQIEVPVPSLDDQCRVETALQHVRAADSALVRGQDEADAARRALFPAALRASFGGS